MHETAVELHPHVAESTPRGHVRVDLHLHTCFSGDAVTTLDELEEHVAAARLDVVCVTDHQAISGAMQAMERDVGCRVIIGEEIKTLSGELIGLFLGERIPFGLSAYETARRIKDQGGVVYVPHPFDPTRRCMEEPMLRDMCENGAIDALEGFNAKVSLQHLNRNSMELAAVHGIPAGAGSDAHDPAAIGAAYVEMPDFDGPADLLEKLHEARIVGHSFDRPRAFVPRVIPAGLRQT